MKAVYEQPSRADVGLRHAALKGFLIAAPIGLIAALVWWMVDSGWFQSAPAPSAAGAPTLQNTATVAAAEDPLKIAEDALAEGNIFSPPGVNAVEAYLAVREQGEFKARAEAALWELLPLLDAGAQRASDGSDPDELARLLSLLERIDSGHLSLASLRAREIQLRAASDQFAAARLRQAQAAGLPQASSTPPAPLSDTADAASAALPTSLVPGTGAPKFAGSVPDGSVPEGSVPDGSVPEGSALERPAPSGASPAVTPENRPAAAVARVEPPAEPASEVTRSAAKPSDPGAVTQAPARPKLVRDANVSYPARALQRRIEGWVEIEFTVLPDGRATNARVVAAQPAKIFDREALTAASRWRFEARDSPYEGMRRRLEFRLPG